MKFHLNYQALLDHRTDLNCQRIIATHMSEDVLKQLDRLQIDHAFDGKVVEL